MPTSPPGNEPGSSSGSDAADSENSDSSSSDFEIQAVTSADGVRSESVVVDTERVKEQGENKGSQNESQSVVVPSNATNGAHPGLLGLDVYSDSSSSDDDLVATPASTRKERGRKRVRFAEDPPEKRQRVEERNGQVSAFVNVSRINPTAEEEDEVAVLTELAEFEAAVADAGRDIDDIEADIADAEDAREEEKERELHNTVQRLREEFLRKKEHGKMNRRGEGT